MCPPACRRSAPLCGKAPPGCRGRAGARAARRRGRSPGLLARRERCCATRTRRSSWTASVGSTASTRWSHVALTATARASVGTAAPGCTYRRARRRHAMRGPFCACGSAGAAPSRRALWRPSRSSRPTGSPSRSSWRSRPRRRPTSRADSRRSQEPGSGRCCRSAWRSRGLPRRRTTSCPPRCARTGAGSSARAATCTAMGSSSALFPSRGRDLCQMAPGARLQPTPKAAPDSSPRSPAGEGLRHGLASAPPRLAPCACWSTGASWHRRRPA
mmetsp:Transcript_66992/g.187257  ORF Transcript_66992/g.187257 Transcript_66992/m.187257 type:complete len:272 (+) Transcript_66992:95-910(+)